MWGFSAPSHQNIDLKSWTPWFWTPGLLREVIFSYNKYVNFMTSGMKTSPKKPLRLISGDVLLELSCINMQKYKIQEKSYIELYTVKCYFLSPWSDQAEILIMRSVCENNFNGALGLLLTVFWGTPMQLSTGEFGMLRISSLGAGSSKRTSSKNQQKIYKINEK